MERAAPHVLYVAWGFPPCRSGGVYRALATAEAFAARGWRVTVLTATRETFERYTGTDASLESLVDPAIRVVRVPFAWPARDTDPQEWSPLRRRFPRAWRAVRRRLDLLPFPEPVYGPWRSPLERAATAVHAADPVDLVVATANPNVDFMAADVLHRRHGVPYVMDYRDAWMLDVFEGTQTWPDGSRVDRLERRLIDSAAEVWFVNDPIRTWHAERHPGAAARMQVVANGFDGRFMPSMVQPRTRAPGEGLRFGYIGTVSRKVPLADFAAGWRRAREVSPLLRRATAELWGYLGFYQDPSRQSLDVLSAHEQDGIAYRGPVGKSDVAGVYATFDATLLILGTGRYVTSGKVYEYLAAGAPIVSVHDPGNAASEVLRGYPLWFPVPDLQPDSIAAALVAAAHAAEHPHSDVREACRLFAAQYAREAQLLPRVDALRRLVDPPDA